MKKNFLQIKKVILVSLLIEIIKIIKNYIKNKTSYNVIYNLFFLHKITFI